MHPALFACLVSFLVGFGSSPTGEKPCPEPDPIESVTSYANELAVLSDGYRTLFDLWVPTAPAGPRGWPMVVFIHGNGQSKEQLTDVAHDFALRGYATLTYDVRGQGTSMLLNDPLVYGRGGYGVRERLDLFEVLEAAEAFRPDDIDFTRLGVTGPTQGGFLAWIAAAHSGRTLPPNPWRQTPLPTIEAVVSHEFAPDMWGWMIPEKRAITEMTVFNFFEHRSGLHLDPAFSAQLTPLIHAEDYLALHELFNLIELHLPTLLEQSTVPVMAMLPYDDKYGPSNGLLDAWDRISPGSPKLLNLTSSGRHATPYNEKERDLYEYRMEQWFDRFLKGVQNGIEDSPEFRFAIAPEEIADFQDSSSIWDVRSFDSWPPPETALLRLYLASDGSLTSSPPMNPRGKHFLNHSNTGGLVIEDYTLNLPTPEQVQQQIPLNTVAYETPPFTDDLLLLGSSTASLVVSTSDPRFQIHVALLDVDQAGEERFIAGGHTTVRDNLPPGDHRLDFPISTYGYVLREGHRLRVQLENLAWHRPPIPSTATFLYALPIFEDFSVAVRHSSLAPSYLDLATIPFGDPSLEASEVRVSRDSPEDLELVLFSDSSRSGWTYQILIGTSGTTPGTVHQGVTIPLNFDHITFRALNTPEVLPIADFSGTLGSKGEASASVFLSQYGSLNPNVAAIYLTAVVADPQGQLSVAEPVVVAIE